MRNPLVKAFSMILALSASWGAFATGSCVSEDSEQAYPANGAWFNPEQPGTGYLIYRQCQRLLGYYFGYGQSGESRWWLFSGVIEPVSAGQEFIWRVEADLESFSDGRCPGCTFSAPERRFDGTVELDFAGAAAATVRLEVAGADIIEERITPLAFGVESLRNQPSDQLGIPDLTGTWIATVLWYEAEGEVPTIAFTDIVSLSSLSPTSTDGRFRVSTNIADDVTSPNPSILGSLTCDVSVEQMYSRQFPTGCTLNFEPATPTEAHIGDFSYDRIQGIPRTIVREGNSIVEVVRFSRLN